VLIPLLYTLKSDVSEMIVGLNVKLERFKSPAQTPAKAAQIPCL